jgi:hypothetical protein
MKTYDNHGNLAGEINNIITPDGKQITTNTTYSNYGGQPKVERQHIS